MLDPVIGYLRGNGDLQVGWWEASVGYLCYPVVITHRSDLVPSLCHRRLGDWYDDEDPPDLG